MGRAPCCDKSNVKKGPWSPEEDSRLKAYIDMHGTGGNWITLPQKIGLKRCGKSCRLRWLNYLRPNIKHGGFSEEEDNIICSLYISIGSRWSVIAAQLPGRTDNDIKNYWNTRLKKKLLGRRKQSNQYASLTTNNPYSKNEEEAIDNSYSHALSNSAFERLQLHMQLQSIQYPLSPCIFPNLHPFQEKMIQSLQCSNQNSSLVQQQVLQTSPPSLLLGQQNAHSNFYEPKPTIIMDQQIYESPEISTFIELKSDTNIHGHFNGQAQELSTFPSKVVVDSFLNNKTASDFIPHYYDHDHDHQDQIADFDCFEEVEGTKDCMIWWPSSSNDFGSNSASASSWDSSSLLD